jgi:hypothetical protein
LDIPVCGGELVSVAQSLAAARKKRRLLHLGSGATLLLGSRVGAVVVVTMRLVALLDLGLIHWKKSNGQLRKLHRVQV